MKLCGERKALEQNWIATEVSRCAFNEGFTAESLHALHVRQNSGECFLGVIATATNFGGANEIDEHMFVRQGGSHFVRVDRSPDGHDLSVHMPNFQRRTAAAESRHAAQPQYCVVEESPA
jgi:hypothetical protein